MPETFISYSRKNMDFVKKLVDGLKSRGKKYWWDKNPQPLKGIVGGDPWWKQIQQGIESADNFLFVISPESITSEVCHVEIAHARKHGKRIIPVIFCEKYEEKETFDKVIPNALDNIKADKNISRAVIDWDVNLKTLAQLHWMMLQSIHIINYFSTIQFSGFLDDLTTALDADLEWEKEYSKLFQAAQDWADSGHSDAFLWPDERINPIREMIEQRNKPIDTFVQNFIQPEADRLVLELHEPDTTHHRRSFIGERLSAIGDSRPGVGLNNGGVPRIEWREVPGGLVEVRGKIFAVRPFYIAKYPITYVQFQAFLDTEDPFENDLWWEGIGRRERVDWSMEEQRNCYSNYPRENVNWFQALAYTRWLNSIQREKELLPSRKDDTKIEAKFEYEGLSTPTSWGIRLPTAWEWQQAATGGNIDPTDYRLFGKLSGTKYPWGNDWKDGKNCNSKEAGIGRTTAVGMYPQRASPVGALDMAGNIGEWCINTIDSLEVENWNWSRPISINMMPIQGGSFDSNEYDVRCSSREHGVPYIGDLKTGLRVVCATAPSAFVVN